MRKKFTGLFGVWSPIKYKILYTKQNIYKNVNLLNINGMKAAVIIILTTEMTSSLIVPQPHITSVTQVLYTQQNNLKNSSRC